MSKNKIFFTAALVVAVTVVVCNYPMTYRIGVDGIVQKKKIPFYAKACGFLYRDWMYKDIVHEIVGSEPDETKKALAILDWTNNNIMRGIPEGLKAIDDHPLNIIIRQYGEPDQLDDIFTILCSYAGMEAGWNRCYNTDRSKKAILSFVKVAGRWIVFDASRNKYFMNREGKIANVDDCARGSVIMSVEDAADYGDLLTNIKDTYKEYSIRPDEQKPFKRLIFELKNIFNKDLNRIRYHDA